MPSHGEIGLFPAFCHNGTGPKGMARRIEDFTDLSFGAGATGAVIGKTRGCMIAYAFLSCICPVEKYWASRFRSSFALLVLSRK